MGEVPEFPHREPAEDRRSLSRLTDSLSFLKNSEVPCNPFFAGSINAPACAGLKNERVTTRPCANWAIGLFRAAPVCSAFGPPQSCSLSWSRRLRASSSGRFTAPAQTAWESVYYLQHEVMGGWVLRAMHYHAGQVLLGLIGLYILHMVFTRAYPPRGNSSLRSPY